jgi:hypothetical protein
MWYSNLKKKLFPDISSTNIVTLVPSLYQCVETRSIEIFLTVVSANSAPPFQPLRHQPNVCHRVVHRCSSIVHTSSLLAILTTKTSFLTWHAGLLPGLSWSWIVLLPSDTHRKPISSITAVLFSFVTYLLTLPRTSIWQKYVACVLSK